ncbi:MAG: peptidylprolyl isomerase [Bacteroidota bacterium]
MTTTLGSLMFLAWSVQAQQTPDTLMMRNPAPEKFSAEFHTTKGNFTIEVIREWSPAGADRLYQLIHSGFYSNNAIFRVQKDYVVQFGIGDEKEINHFWDIRPIDDEPVKSSNLKGTISFARDGAKTRTAQLFINLKDNPKLDTVKYNNLRGFPPVARVILGMEVIESFYADYGFEPANHQDSVMVKGNAYWKILFPKLDYIRSASIIK